MGLHGALVIRKPMGMTSHDVVNRVRRITGEKSVGHLGTLDPMATGVLPMLLGKLTRLSQFYLKSEKEYSGEIRFGFSTDTYDADGEKVGESRPVKLELDKLKKIADQFVGETLQMPPPFSAKKVKGVPAYKLARKNIETELKPVPITVHKYQIVQLYGDLAEFVIEVSAGTYVRGIAHEMGKVMGCGAHLARLERTRSGDFTLQQSVTLEELDAAVRENRIEQVMIPIKYLLPNIPNVIADEPAGIKIRHGNAVNLPIYTQAKFVKVFDTEGELVAIGQQIAGSLYQPKIVLV
jgi:tRNA pseudouridine55 synthase